MRVGLALVFSLMLFAPWNDLVRYGVIQLHRESVRLE